MLRTFQMTLIHTHTRARERTHTYIHTYIYTCNQQFQSAFTLEENSDPPLKGASQFPYSGKITVDPKGVANIQLLTYVEVDMEWYRTVNAILTDAKWRSI